MPLSPDFRRCEHATRAAHVTESSLTSTMSSTTRDTRNTCNSTTCKFTLAIAKPNQTPAPFIIPHSHPQFHFPALELSQREYVLTGTPRLCRSLMTSLLAHRIWLSLVLCHASMNRPVCHQQLPNSITPRDRTELCQVELATGTPWAAGAWNRWACPQQTGSSR